MASLNRSRSRPRTARAVTAVSLAFLVTMMGTTLPTPLYAIYASELAFSSLTVTVLFAVYAIGVVGALLLFGRLSDDIGRRPVLMMAVACTVLGAITFLLPPSLPPSLPLLIVARVLSGLGAGLMSGTGTAAIIDLFPGARGRAGGLAVAVNSGGLALGTLFAGIVAAVASRPLVVPYAVHLGLGVVAFAVLVAWVPAPTTSAPFRVRPQRLYVPSAVRGAFVRSVLAGGAGFAVTGVLTAVSALFLARHLHLESHALAGFVVFLAFAGMAVGQLLARRFAPRGALLLGCAGLVASSGMLAVALAATVLAPLIAAAAVLGVSSGLCISAGIASTVERVEPMHRGAVSSSFFAALYFQLAVPAIGVGLLASVVGLRTAGLVFASLVAVLSAAVGIVELRVPRRPGV